MTKLLFVDDDTNMSELYLIHGRTAGFDTSVCLSGVEALKCVEDTKPDIIVMDLAMPGMDGLRTAKEIRKNEALTNEKPVRLVFLTGYDLNETIEKVARDVGVETDLKGNPKIYTKPIDLSLMLAELRQFVDKTIIVKENGGAAVPITISFIGAVAIILVVTFFLYSMNRQKTEFDNVLHTEQEKWAMDWAKTKSQRDQLKLNCDMILRDKQTLEKWIEQQNITPPPELLTSLPCSYIEEK